MPIKFRAALICGLLILSSGCSRDAETSLEFGSEKMRVLFEAIRPSITSGFGEPQMAQIERDFTLLAMDGTKEVTLPIVHDGVESNLRIQFRKEDVDTVEMHFFGTPNVVEKIEGLIRTTPLDSN